MPLFLYNKWKKKKIKTRFPDQEAALKTLAQNKPIGLADIRRGPSLDGMPAPASSGYRMALAVGLSAGKPLPEPEDR